MVVHRSCQEENPYETTYRIHCLNYPWNSHVYHAHGSSRKLSSHYSKKIMDPRNREPTKISLIKKIDEHNINIVLKDLQINIMSYNISKESA